MKNLIKHSALAALTCSALAPSLGHALEFLPRAATSMRSEAMGGTKILTGLYEDNFNGNPARSGANPRSKFQLPDITIDASSAAISNLPKLLSGANMQSIGETTGKNLHARFQLIFPAYYHVGERNSWGAGLILGTQANLNARSSYQVDPGTQVDAMFAFNFSRKFLEDLPLTVGITTKFAYRLALANTITLIDILKGTGLGANSGNDGARIDFDLGGTYKAPWRPLDTDLTFGLSFQNFLGGKYSMIPLHIITGSSTLVVKPQPFSINFGASLTKPEWGNWKNVAVALEFQDLGNVGGGSLFKTIHIGAEAKFGIIIPRLGINQGYFTGGLGFDFGAVSLDLTTTGEEGSLNAGGYQDRRFGLHLGFQT